METELKSYTYVSSLGQHMEDFICLKRSLGYKYNDEAYFLSQFDRYWASVGDGSVFVPFASVSGYLGQGQGGARRSRRHRLGVFAQVAKC